MSKKLVAFQMLLTYNSQWMELLAIVIQQHLESHTFPHLLALYISPRIPSL